jgi:hypothetical protein
LPFPLEEITKYKFIIYNNVQLKVPFIIDIIHNLLVRYFFRRENHYNLSSLILKEKYGQHYNHYMNYLLVNNYIILEKDYLVGSNTKIYSLNGNLINDKMLRYKNTDKIILRKYKEAVAHIETDDIKTNKIPYDIKLKLINDLYLTSIDYEASLYYINNTVQTVDAYNKNRYSIETIKEKHYYYSFDDYGRLHTNFTTLKSFIRKHCVKINNHATIEFDIQNSQPMFLAKLIYEECMYINKEEFNLYCYLVFNGLLYQYIMDKTGIKTKKECKEAVYKVFFGSNKSDAIFDLLFPSIHNFIRDYKTEYSNYRILSHKLQQMESELIFNKIIRNIFTVNPDIAIITVHDSIIVEYKYKDLVGKIFNSIIEEEFNFMNKNNI